MKMVVAIVLALFIGHFFIAAFFWVLSSVFTFAWELSKFIMALIVALPFYFIIRRKLLR